VFALVLIVLFALLGTYMLTLTVTGSLSTTQSASAMQAWFAARSGAEWAVHQSLAASDGGCTCAVNCCAGIDGETVNFSGGGMNGFVANTACASRAVTEAGTDYCVYDLEIGASNSSPGPLTSVFRSITLSVTDRDAP